MNQKITIAIAAFVFMAFSTFAQDAPVFSQFWQNPFQFNPSYAAHQGYSEINLFYRKQWLGIENAPTVGAINFQMPLGKNVSTGISVVSNKTILLNANSATAVFAYRVRLGAYHNLNFGLGAGISFNNFDLEALANSNDPALANIIPKSQYMTGEFGFNYRYRNFNIGFALPNLFDSKPNTLNEFQKIEFDPFRNKFGTVSYNIVLNQIQLTPTILYRALDNQQTQWEGMVLATYKGFLWAGVSYRDGYGLTGLIGVKLKTNYKIGYAYEHPTSGLESAANGSHELYFGMRVGKRDREEEYLVEKKKADSLKQVADVERIAKEEAEKAKALASKQESEKQPAIIINESEKQPTQSDLIAALADTTSTKTLPEPPADYYVVLGSYRIQANARKQVNELRNQGLMPEILYNLANNVYYVYLYKTTINKDALEELTRERNKNRYQGVWLYKVPKPVNKN